MSRVVVLPTSKRLMHTSPAAAGFVPLSSPKSCSQRHGFTLIELIIATVVLVVGLVALTSAGAAIIRLESRGERLSLIAGAGETRLDLLRSTGCASAAGHSRMGRLEERWGVARTLSHLAVIVDSAGWSDSDAIEPYPVYVFRSAVRC